MDSKQQTDSPAEGATAGTVLRNAATRSTIDGVTTLFSAIGSRTYATLSFRVGTSDEPLHQRGINHVIGHLASAAADQDLSACHVGVSASTLSFHFVGGALAVANEIGAVCHWITTASGAPPDERAFGRARDAARADQHLHAPEHLSALRVRLGPHGWAAGSYPELGLDALTPADITAWVAKYLTASNAVLALSGTKATTLRVPLPAGEYRPLRTSVVDFLQTPAIAPTPTAQLNLSGLVRTDANRLDRDRAVAGLSTEILRSRIAYALGRRYGREIVVRGGPMTLGPSTVHAVVHAEVDADREAKVADIAVEAMTVLAEQRLLDGELAAHVKRRLGAYQRAAATRSGQHELLNRQALGALNDTPWSLALERRMLRTAEQGLVEAQVADIAGSALLMMREVAPPVRPWNTPPEPGAFAADGDVFRSRPAYGLRRGHPSRLIVGSEGVTVRTMERPDTQLRWDSIAMVQRWSDGALLLTGTRGHTLNVTPERWLAPQLALDAVCDRLADQPTIAMGERDTPAAEPARITDSVAPAWWWVIAALGACLVAAAASPIWGATPAWVRWLLGAIAVIALVIGGAWAYETAMTEHRLRSDSAARTRPASPEQDT